MVLDWPPHQYETRAWGQQHRAGTRDDRTLSEIEVALPPLIAALEPSVNGALAADIESAMAAITALDSAHGSQLSALSVLLLRTESVASSKIESVEASLDDYARALHGIRTNRSAVSMVAATEALAHLITSVNGANAIELSAITSAHAALMGDEPSEAAYVGRVRDMQNWIGGSDYSPRAALYLPPPPETVLPYLQDLVAFANRDDLPALVQAAIAHAQFESIHPFTDGNGRIGRALINTVLRRRGATSHLVVPLASALVAHKDRYFDVLESYREGNLHPLLASFSECSRVAAAEARTTAERLTQIPQQWRELVGRVRSGSAAAALLAVLPAEPILSIDDACAATGAAPSSMYAAIERLVAAGILRPLTNRKRDQVWGAALVLDELEDLGTRIAYAMR